MTKFESFSNVSIEVPISGTQDSVIVEKDFWDGLCKSGVTVIFKHGGRPHVSDPVKNGRKHSVARLVMKCEAGFSAKPTNPDEPLNLTPANLTVVADGRAKYAAKVNNNRRPKTAPLIGEYEPTEDQLHDWMLDYDCELPEGLTIKVYGSVKREARNNPEKAQPSTLNPDFIDPGVGNGNESEVHEDIEETLPSAPDESVEVDQSIDDADLVVVIKDGRGLEGGIRSSRRFSPPQSTLGLTDFDHIMRELDRHLAEKARVEMKVLPSKGTKCKRFSQSWLNAGKVYKS